MSTPSATGFASASSIGPSSSPSSSSSVLSRLASSRHVLSNQVKAHRVHEAWMKEYRSGQQRCTKRMKEVEMEYEEWRSRLEGGQGSAICETNKDTADTHSSSSHRPHPSSLPHSHSDHDFHSSLCSLLSAVAAASNSTRRLGAELYARYMHARSTVNMEVNKMRAGERNGKGKTDSRDTATQHSGRSFSHRPMSAKRRSIMHAAAAASTWEGRNTPTSNQPLSTDDRNAGRNGSSIIDSNSMVNDGAVSSIRSFLSSLASSLSTSRDELDVAIRNIEHDLQIGTRKRIREVEREMQREGESANETSADNMEADEPQPQQSQQEHRERQSNGDSDRGSRDGTVDDPIEEDGDGDDEKDWESQWHAGLASWLQPTPAPEFTYRPTTRTLTPSSAQFPLPPASPPSSTAAFPLIEALEELVKEDEAENKMEALHNRNDQPTCAAVPTSATASTTSSSTHPRRPGRSAPHAAVPSHPPALSLTLSLSPRSVLSAQVSNRVHAMMQQHESKRRKQQQQQHQRFKQSQEQTRRRIETERQLNGSGGANRAAASTTRRKRFVNGSVGTVAVLRPNAAASSLHRSLSLPTSSTAPTQPSAATISSSPPMPLAEGLVHTTPDDDDKLDHIHTADESTSPSAATLDESLHRTGEGGNLSAHWDWPDLPPMDPALTALLEPWQEEADREKTEARVEAEANKKDVEQHSDVASTAAIAPSSSPIPTIVFRQRLLSSRLSEWTRLRLEWDAAVQQLREEERSMREQYQRNTDKLKQQIRLAEQRNANSNTRVNVGAEDDKGALIGENDVNNSADHDSTGAPFITAAPLSFPQQSASSSTPRVPPSRSSTSSRSLSLWSSSMDERLRHLVSIHRRQGVPHSVLMHRLHEEFKQEEAMMRKQMAAVVAPTSPSRPQTSSLLSDPLCLSARVELLSLRRSHLHALSLHDAKLRSSYQHHVDHAIAAMRRWDQSTAARWEKERRRKQRLQQAKQQSDELESLRSLKAARDEALARHAQHVAELERERASVRDSSDASMRENVSRIIELWQQHQQAELAEAERLQRQHEEEESMERRRQMEMAKPRIEKRNKEKEEEVMRQKAERKAAAEKAEREREERLAALRQLVAPLIARDPSRLLASTASSSAAVDPSVGSRPLFAVHGYDLSSLLQDRRFHLQLALWEKGINVATSAYARDVIKQATPATRPRKDMESNAFA